MARISEHLKKELYLESMRKRVRHLYVYGESHPAEKDLIAHKLDGFLEAALLLQILSKDQLQQVIDEEHVAIFGMSREERARKRQEEGTSPELADWSAYESPATDRMSAKTRRARRYGAKTKITENNQPDTSAVKRING